LWEKWVAQVFLGQV
jgi:hypothetical protein